MIQGKGENWDELPAGFKRGRTFYKGEDSRYLHEIWKDKEEIACPDFLKQRPLLTSMIPKINA